MKLKNLFLITFFSALSLVIVSYVGFYYELVATIAMSALTIGVILLSLRNIQYGLLCIVAELCLGSQGYLLSLTVDNTVISLRMALWIIVMAVWFGQEIVAIIRHQAVLKKYKDIQYWRPLVAFGGIMILGLLVGWLQSNNFTFFVLESKRWLYALILIPLLVSFKTKEAVQKLLIVVFASTLVLCLQNIIIIYIFSHNFIPFVYDCYAWLRRDLLAEITASKNGFYRVFIQSQIFILPLIIGSYVYCLTYIKNSKTYLNSKRIVYLLITSFGLVCLISSLSRSFWLGLVGAIIITAITYIFQHRPLRRHIIYSALAVILIVVLSIGLLFSLIRFPYPEPRSRFDISLLSDRAKTDEAAAAARWALLPVMTREILRSPLFGYGFGKTLTYKTSDPRIVNSTVNGEFTTYAFEWGWLDIALKFGLFGLLVYGWLIGRLIKDSYILMKSESVLGSVLFSSLVAISIIHFFTPYLNHPLGFGYLGLIMILTKKSDILK